MRRLVLSGLTVMAAALGGCATIERGTDDEVAVISDPPGAAVSTSLGASCPVTPCTVIVGRAAVFSVTVSKPGYASRTVAVTTRLSGAGAAVASENVVTAGLGLAVDAATGATLEHVPSPIAVTLTSLASPTKRPSRGPAS